MTDLLYCLQHDGITQVAAAIAVLCFAGLVWLAWTSWRGARP
jgi:hypothetical protein